MKDKSFKIITFGCRVNQAESRIMGEEISKGIKGTRSIKGEELVIINTCCVTNKAEREVRKEIRRVKRENSQCFLVAAGCWVEKIKNKKLNKSLRPDSKTLALIDLLLTNKEKMRIGEILANISKDKITLSRVRSRTQESKYEDKYKGFGKALVKIQEGCDQFCTYCIVPYARGRSKSRYSDDILKEIRGLVRNGISEIVLTGIDISAFKLKIKHEKLKITVQNSRLNKLKNNLVRLIKLILIETEIKKISFGSMGLGVFDEEFIGLYDSYDCAGIANQDFCVRQSSAKNNLGLTTHFHIPLQSGSDQTLKRMNRRYTVSQFCSVIFNLKKKIPNFTFSTDLIVGFPGESREELEQTIRTIKTLKKKLGKAFDHVHIFRYSPRQGTTAEKMESKWGRIEEKEKKRRAKVIEKLMKKR